MAELEARSGAPAPAPTAPQAPQPQAMNPLQRRMGIRGERAGQGTDTLLPNIGSAISNAGYEAGGMATDAASSLGASPETAGAIGYGANLATDVVPMFVGGVASTAAKAPEALRGASNWLMRKAVKPPIDDIPAGNRAIQTLLDEGINPTFGGAEKLREKVEEIKPIVKALIANSTETVKKSAVGQRLKDVLDNFKWGSPEERALIEKAWKDFRDHPDLRGKLDIPIRLAQEAKQGIYKALSGQHYGEMKGAAIESQKALGRGLKEEIAAKVPEVAGHNQKMADLLNAREMALRRAATEGNTNVAGIGAISPTWGGALGFIADKTALAKALAARLLYSQAKAASASAGRLAGGAAGAYQSQPPEGY